MMTEDFVSFSLAKKLKEKNFIGNIEIGLQCGFYYKDGEDIDVFYDGCDNADVAADEYLRPSISQVLKWLRDAKAISVEPYASASGWRVTICRAYHQDRCDAGGGTCLKREVIGYNDGGAWDKYEEAAIAGIEYCLDNLI